MWGIKIKFANDTQTPRRKTKRMFHDFKGKCVIKKDKKDVCIFLFFLIKINRKKTKLLNLKKKLLEIML